jgi:hypothetical protein
MITGNKERKIKEYLSIDHTDEGFGFTKPEKGEDIIGIPYGYYSENSYPFIEHRKNGIVIQTVNAIDVSIIVFDV